MKNFKNYLAFLAVFALFFTSCSKDEAGVQNEPSAELASLTFTGIMADFNKSAAKQMDDYPDCSDETPTHAQISLVYGDAEIPVNVQVNISQDAAGLFTVYHEDLEIPVPSGQNWVDVTLLNFDVYSGTTLSWTAPMDGSEFGEFVTDALPMDFQLRAGSKNYVDVEVLCFDNREVNRYGYQFFNIIPEQLRQLCFFVNYCSDEGRHYTADYDLNVYYYAGNDTENVAWEDLDLIYSDSPAALSDNGAFYTDPLCFAIPEPQLSEAADQPYLYYEVTLVDWTENYPAANVVQTGFLTWNDIVDLLDPNEDGDWENDSDSNYYHVQLNCGDDDGENGPVEGDADGDGVVNGEDDCENTPTGATVDENGCPMDSDGDGVYDGIDQCPNTEPGVDVDALGCQVDTGVVECIPSPVTGCETSDYFTVSVTNGAGLLPTDFGDISVDVLESGDLFVGVTPIVPYEISDLQVLISDSSFIDCYTTTEPSEGISGTIEGNFNSTSFEVQVKFNYCDVSQ